MQIYKINGQQSLLSGCLDMSTENLMENSVANKELGTGKPLRKKFISVVTEFNTLVAIFMKVTKIQTMPRLSV